MPLLDNHPDRLVDVVIWQEETQSGGKQSWSAISAQNNTHIIPHIMLYNGLDVFPWIEECVRRPLSLGFKNVVF